MRGLDENYTGPIEDFLADRVLQAGSFVNDSTEVSKGRFLYVGVVVMGS